LYVAKSDAIIIREGGGWEMMREYCKKFGEGFPPFSYQEFRSDGIRPAGQVYIDALQEALKTNKPYQCKTKERTVDEILEEHGLLDK
jgi:hypothetical protein